MFGEILRELRTASKMSQIQLAKAIGVSQGTVYFWENNINEPSAAYLVKLSEFFSIDIETLLGVKHEVANKQGTIEVLDLFNQMNFKQRELSIAIMKEILKN